MTENADLCIWPGCSRPRAPGRASGSGRQREYCLQADPPERGGSPVHNARNRWAALRSGAERSARAPGTGVGDFAAATVGETTDGSVSAPPVRDPGPLTSAKRRAGELLEQARRQHAAALASLQAERELYTGIGEQLAVLSDPASADLEVAAIASRAGRDLAQAAEDAAQARRAQLTAMRERDDAVAGRTAADAAAEQAAEDAAAAERALSERTAGFERDLADQVNRARAAAEAERAARGAADAARLAADEAVDWARLQVEQAAAAASAARQETASAQARADDLIGQARADAARERAAAHVARDETGRVRAEAQAAQRQAEEAQRGAEAQIASARAEAQAAGARAAAVDDEAVRLRAGLRERSEAHAAELARLAAAHQAALEAERALLAAERARAARAEAGLDALRRENPAG